MEQVFGLVNGLLRGDARTRQRRLHVRTYNVVPLVGKNGIIQFVTGGDVLRSSLVHLHEACVNSCTGQH